MAAIAAVPLLVTLLLLLAGAGDAVRFDFGSITLAGLRLLGEAHVRNGSIRLTRDLPVPTSGAGRALYASAVPVRDAASGRPVPFSTYFSFSVSLLNPSSVGGGVAFLLTSNSEDVGDAGPYLGLVNSSAAAAAAGGRIVAVEFDTFMDVEFDDINANHVGVDLGGMVSARVADLTVAGVEINGGEAVNAWVEYTAAAELRVFVSHVAVRPPDPVLSMPLDLGEYFDEAAFVGFSASTQGSTEAHAVDWWSFSSSPSPAPAPGPRGNAAAAPPRSAGVGTAQPPPAYSAAPPVTISAVVGGSPTGAVFAPAPARQSSAAVAGVATAGAFVAASFASFAIWAFARHARSRARAGRERNGLTVAAEMAQAPREFSYKELKAATRGFDASRVVGHGACGTVYKGIVPGTGAMVAVKRCAHGRGPGAAAAAGRTEFMTELSVLAGLRHRHLVRLQGWCLAKGEILLVYDYMRHGSLDRVLFDRAAPPLPWRLRVDALAGVASALAYLHRECEHVVIHRDVKSGNVLLDEGYRARLGDFGLARQAEHGESPGAGAAAGTMGYLAPEYLLTGRATEATDVFSFGALALEVACGRRPIDGEGRHANLVEWVWALHGDGRVLDCVDPRMRGEYDEGEAIRVLLIGLACSNPDPVLRPGMRAVVQVLAGEADPPAVPPRRPSTSTTSTHELLLNLQDSVSDYDAMGVILSRSSSSELSTSSLRSTLRGGGGTAAG